MGIHQVQSLMELLQQPREVVDFQAVQCSRAGWVVRRMRLWGLVAKESSFENPCITSFEE